MSVEITGDSYGAIQKNKTVLALLDALHIEGYVDLVRLSIEGKEIRLILEIKKNSLYEIRSKVIRISKKLDQLLKQAPYFIQKFYLSPLYV